MLSILKSFSNQNTHLSGTLHLPEGDGPFPAVIVLHAAGGGLRSSPFYQHLIEVLPANGCAVFLYDRRGSGESGGDFNSAGFDLLASDGAAAFDLLKTIPQIDQKRIGFYGISQGGWLAPMAAALRPEAAFLLIISGSGVSPARQMGYAAGRQLRDAGFSEDDIRQALALRGMVNEYYRGRLSRAEVQAEIDRCCHLPWFEPAFLSGDTVLPEDVRNEKWSLEMDHEPLAAWRKVRQPALFLYGGQDIWVPVEESMRLFSGVAVNSRFHIFPGLDHMMKPFDLDDESFVSPEYVVTLLDWLTYLNP
jgi:pimeloyl-ACP methyl ester carboxylesterase